MADVLPTITESKALELLRGFFLTLVSCEVIRAQQNRVPMPKTDFIALTPITLTQLNVPFNTNTATTQTIEQHYQFQVQVDCYGAAAMGRATTLIMLLRDSVATEYFDSTGYDMQTLNAEDARQLPIIDDQNQFFERWTFTAVLQLNQQITITTETANTVSVDLINVDATYPA